MKHKRHTKGNREVVKRLHSQGFSVIFRRPMRSYTDPLVVELAKLTFEELHQMERLADQDLGKLILSLHNIHLARGRKDWLTEQNTIKSREVMKDDSERWLRAGEIVKRILPPGTYSSGDFLRGLAKHPDNPFPGMTTSDSTCRAALTGLTTHCPGLVLRRDISGKRTLWSVIIK